MGLGRTKSTVKTLLRTVAAFPGRATALSLAGRRQFRYSGR